MNLRILKKLSKRAAPILLDRFCLSPSTLYIADNDDSTYAETNIDRKHQDHARIHSRGYEEAWPGTPYVGWMSCGESPEWESRTAWAELQNQVGGEVMVEIGERDESGCPENVAPAFDMSPINVFAYLRGEKKVCN